MIRIARMSPVDADAAALALESLYHRSPQPDRRLAAMLEDPGFLLLLAEFDDSHVGYLHGQIFDRLDGTCVLLIYDVTVEAEYRRKGVGTELMKSALSYARDARAAACWLITDEDNIDAGDFYKSLDGQRWPAVGFRWAL